MTSESNIRETADAKTLGELDTLVASVPDAPALEGSSGPGKPSGTRTTILPRIEGKEPNVRLVSETKMRYAPLRVLGSGGMGEVVLVHDEDIARKVAMKRLSPAAGHSGLLARFVDEIRTVGRLEHPNIVPIHDVGMDEEGRYFFVMKYVEGETLESIIDRLSEGNAEYHDKYTFELRLELFIQVLQALAYAHAHGVVHRDIKPANVMIGRFGEVMLMDWGIAKPLSQERDLAVVVEGVLEESEKEPEKGKMGTRTRMYATRVGTLVGTPAYMAPEQARGDNHLIDERTDLYSACAMFYEMLSLRHYFGEKVSVDELLKAVISEEVSFERLLELASAHPHQVRPPVELLRWIETGLQKNPSHRYGSAETMIESLQDILEGRCEVHCQVTMTKRGLRELARMADQHPGAVLGVVYGAALMMLTCIGLIVYLLVT